MVLEQKLTPRLQQRLVMTPALQLAIRLLQLNRLELQEALQREMEENPLLEEKDGPAEGASAAEAEGGAAAGAEGAPEGEAAEGREGDSFAEINVEAYFQEYYDLRPPTPSMREEREAVPLEGSLAEQPSMEDELLWQLEMTHASPLEMEIGRAIIGNLDDSGYLAASLEEIAAMGPWQVPQVEQALARVQSLDPPGIAARDLRECLLLQLRQLGLADSLAYRIVDEHLDLLTARRHSELARRLGVELSEVADALEVIRHLNPKPGYVYAKELPRHIVPDVIVMRDGDDYRVMVNEDGLPRLRISRFYRRMLRSREELPRETAAFLQSKLRSALWLIKSYGQRQRTIRRVAESIVRHQRDFLEHGVSALRPMVLRDVADDIGMHESTVSRVVKGKYMHTPQGTFEMKFFFHSALIQLGGDEVSSVSVKERIRKMIGSEDPAMPLSDAKIAARLQASGLQIARRTVAKYREEMGIPPSKARRAIR